MVEGEIAQVNANATDVHLGRYAIGCLDGGAIGPETDLALPDILVLDRVQKKLALGDVMARQAAVVGQTERRLQFGAKAKQDRQPVDADAQGGID